MDLKFLWVEIDQQFTSLASMVGRLPSLLPFWGSNER
jgi:hypothetical protein